MAVMSRDQWLIYQPEKVQAAYRALEALGWQAIAGVIQMKIRQGAFPNMEVEAQELAEICEAQGIVRKEYGSGRRQEKPHDEQIHYSILADILDWQMTDPTDEKAKLWEMALDELLAPMKYLDIKVAGAGITGPGWYRELVKGV